MTDVKDAIRQFVLSSYLPGESADNLRDTTPLQTSGILDSLAVLNLVTFIKDRFGVDLDVFETGMDHFDRIEDIAAAIARKQREASRQVEAPGA